MRKCRHCKAELPTLKLSLPVQRAGFCSTDCRHTYKPPKKDKPKKPKVKTIAQELDAAAVLCQRMVRLKAADDNGYCTCITCGKVRKWNDGMQGGHFIERGKKATKADETNIHPQCLWCNRYGMKIASVVLDYEQKLVDYYGRDHVEDLKSKAKRPYKPSREWIAEQVEYFKEQIDFHEKRLGVSK